jgi:hypothetical protein
MRRIMSVPAIVGVLALGACVVAPPPGPSVMAMPGKGKSFAEFQQDDGACRQFASQSIGNSTPGENATNSAVASSVIGTLVGAGLGAGIGAAAGNPGLGAAAGAGAGLLIGTGIGLNASQASGAATQQRYDMSYEQCMDGHGDQVPGSQSASIAAPATGPTVSPVHNQVSPPTANSTSVTPVTPTTTVTPMTTVTPVK